MVNDQSPEALATQFWSATGLSETFPRNIERAVAMTLPLALIKMPTVTTTSVSNWLEHREVMAYLPEDRRDLMGCLVAYRGHGIVFVCGTDDPEEQRLTIAHETGHFLIDYKFPRQHVIHALGERIVGVLDGLRQATPAERANAVLSHVRLGAHVHLLPRPGADEDSDGCVGFAEERAHQLGFELVAPREHMIRMLKKFGTQRAEVSEIAANLSKYFGLPQNAFCTIAEKMIRRRPTSFLESALLSIKVSR